MLGLKLFKTVFSILSTRFKNKKGRFLIVGDSDVLLMYYFNGIGSTKSDCCMAEVVLQLYGKTNKDL